MTSRRDGDTVPSTWAGADKDAPAHLVPVAPRKWLEANGAPIVEQYHEFVITRAANVDAEPRHVGITLKGSVG